MTASWLLAKYIPDLRRQEPMNVGVVVFTDEGVVHRFMGERPDGVIDGRGLRWAGSTDTYKAWVAYWTRLAESGATLDALTARRGDDSYFLEYGGHRLLGEVRDPAAMADQLFDALVEKEPERVGLNVEQLSERVLSNLGIRDRVARDVTFEVPAGAEGASDTISFDYRYDNGTMSLMQRVSLLRPDQRSWDVTHSAVWSFERALEGLEVTQGAGVNCVALVRPRERDQNLQRQLGLIEQFASVVDVSSEDQAVKELGEVLHVA